ncbi:BnaC02g25600D [Brassica napus]|uniref:BnaC02g25600D protein n=1 Tax=Brassica napus TaxID=3708 RepID=A0A078GA35_BRANA|nr:BnaC02g25600D [Brassica napus]
MCKSRFTKSSLKGYPLEDIYVAVGDTKVINSVLVPTIGEQIMLARIIDEEREYDRQGSPSDTWNYCLNVKQKNIWWKELYELDQAARGVLPKNKDKEKVTILEFMREGFVGLHLNSIESKVEPSHGEDMNFRQWDYGTYEEKEKANSEKDKANAEQEAGKENDNIENTEQEAERKNDEEGEEKEVDDNALQEDEKEKENSEADEQDKEDSESKSESEDDQAEVEGKEDQEEEVEGKESETREQEKEKTSG